MRILLSLLLALTVDAQDAKKYCPSPSPMDAEFFVVNDTCYCLSGTTDKKPSWVFANNDCKSMTGRLLIFTDKSNEDAVIDQITMTRGYDSHLYWLGINRAGDSWKWTTGATLTYTPNWDAGTGDCAVINVASKSWSPRDCSFEDWSIGYICQYDSTSSSSRVTQDAKKYCPSPSPMDAEFFVVNDTCYCLSGTTDKKPSWVFANNDCKSMTGRLLIFTDKSNEDAVVDQITMTRGYDSHLYWLGINRAGDSWKWTTGATLTYTPNWDAGTGDCAVINVASKSWSPRDCSFEDWSIGYICQYDSTSSSSRGTQDSTSSSSRVTQDSTSSSSRVTQDAVILMVVVLSSYRIFCH